MSRLSRTGLIVDVVKYWTFNSKAPAVLGFDVTYRCNQRCSYCGVPEFQAAELDTEGALLHLERFIKAGLRFCILGGAEALVREDVIELAKFLKKHRIAVDLNTNGFLLPQRREILQYIDGVAMSLDGPEEIHDKLRGKGAYAAVKRAIEVAKKAKVPVRLNCTLTKGNLDFIDQIFVEAQGLPIRFQPVNPVVCKDTDRFNAAAPQPAQMQLALKKIRRLKKAGAPVLNSYRALDYYMEWPVYSRKVACGSGRLFCRMDPSGAIYSCAGELNGLHTPLMDHPTVMDAMKAIEPKDCNACLCGGTLEMNLLLEGGPFGALLEAQALLRWSR
ncbi:MAG TPA: radical SAM protein [Myxococcota bacterium]|jgi:MoaA/NifB/PqqE/SkfB family radical SAM enzyme|nr:radical SAM protein [Myxococcota bacterium]HON24529.1 radical SAM protein [Myxococcota bacterium]HOS61718.1 radical SAM protein [Myxococcota bacterium]HPC90920.1 radical SAM protein [Myxococcota bacterium]HPL24760.1 radical SAM protein [Myxococcota bacterium]